MKGTVSNDSRSLMSTIREGKLDQVMGKVKQTERKAVDKIKEPVISNRPRAASRCDW
jgi:uncharacterized protein YjbJ (UPF0337 family)